jgi:hypothetical protein
MVEFGQFSWKEDWWYWEEIPRNKQNQRGETQTGYWCRVKSCRFKHSNAKVILLSKALHNKCGNLLLYYTFMLSVIYSAFFSITLIRLQEKISTMESEVKVQRQALLSTPIKSMSEHLSIPIAPKVRAVVCTGEWWLLVSPSIEIFHFFV